MRKVINCILKFQLVGYRETNYDVWDFVINASTRTYIFIGVSNKFEKTFHSYSSNIELLTIPN